jgi:hypothetical protein
MIYLVVVIILILIYYVVSVRRTVCNNIDGRCYTVIDSHDKYQASQLLARLNIFATTLIKHLSKYNSDPKYGPMVKRLTQNYNPNNIIENDPPSNVNTSYVEDKGKVFAICLREKKSGMNRFHDISILQFVVMHEMSHLASVCVGHDCIEFWENFKFLLSEAKSIGIHEPVNYKKSPANYCSLDVNYSPFYDEIPEYFKN